MADGGPSAPLPGMEVTDHQLAEALDSLLRGANSFTSLNGVVQQLESNLGVHLGHKLDFIRTQIHHYLILRSQPHQNFMPHQPHKDLFTLPNFHPAPSPNFAAHLPADGYGFHPTLPTPSQPPPPPPPAPASAVTVASIPGVTANVKESAPSGKKRKGGPGGLNKLCCVSPLLQTIVGQPTLPRTEIVRQLWAYIRKNNLQDPSNKRKIICNDELRLVFETDRTDMFQMNKLLAKHITALDPTKQADQCTKKPKVDVESGSQSDDPVPIVVISDALASFFGTNEKEMSQSEVLRQIWEYIKVNQLEDPANLTAILCDAKLQELLGCESISALGLPEMLAQRHLSKKS
ncbi:SWIB complex BAF60b domain-containing protein [Striga hermonthica]|uniref:SWIB complex BAF60b domain-containing protein n=1 Tax=Striga hermonthica TaxID=68872 RepID=A0A9N7NKQ4_STRHE|nr:SWIB complex BAF60b domain-containing protein [Striga hermonthica]